LSSPNVLLAWDLGQGVRL